MKSSILIRIMLFCAITVFWLSYSADLKAQNCRIEIREVNGIVTPGQTHLTKLRVMGNASGCAGDVVVKSTKTNQVKAQINTLGHFVATLNMTTSANCGDSITVTAWCEADTICKVIERRILKCCEVKNLTFQSVLPPLLMNPTEIIVTGTLLGCADNKIVAEARNGVGRLIGQSTPKLVDPFNGGFAVVIPIDTTMGLKCDDTVKIKAWCNSDPKCFVERDDKLFCAGCFRAQVKVITLPCTGTPPSQQIQLEATISIGAGMIMEFQWDYGDGSFDSPFTIDNSLGTANTTYTRRSTIHNYKTGNYTAYLFVPNSECPKIPVSLTVNCHSGCPTTIIRKMGESATCVNGKRTITLEALVTAPATSAAAGNWDYGYTPPGGSSSGPPVGAPQGGTQTFTTNFDYPPGTYTASIKWNRFVHPDTTCKDATVTFTAMPCPTPPCNVSVDYQPKPVPCISAGNSQQVDFIANFDPAYLGPYKWEVIKGGQSIKEETRCAKSYPTPPSQWLVVTDPEKFSYPVTSSGVYEIIVTVLTHDCSDPFDSDAINIQIEDCCPKFSGNLSANQVARTCEWIFSAQVNNPQKAQLSFEWDFGDGNKQTITPVGPPQSTMNIDAKHTYSTNGQMHVTITVKSPGCGEQLDTNIQVTCQPDTESPTVEHCGVNAGSPGIITITFSEDVDKASAENPANFEVKVNGSVQTPTALSYDPATTTTTITGITTVPGDTVVITVTNVRDIAGNIIVTNGQTNITNCQAPPCPSDQQWDATQGRCVPDKTDSDFDWCVVLLVIWMLAFIATAILLALGYYWPGAVIAGVIYLIFLVLWCIFCCCPCALNFWSCCTFLYWHWLANSVVLIIFSLIGVKNSVVGWVYGGLQILLGFLLAFANCGSLPNPFDPSTWPPARCP